MTRSVDDLAAAVREGFDFDPTAPTMYGEKADAALSELVALVGTLTQEREFLIRQGDWLNDHWRALEQARDWIAEEDEELVPADADFRERLLNRLTAALAAAGPAPEAPLTEEQQRLALERFATPPENPGRFRGDWQPHEVTGIAPEPETGIAPERRRVIYLTTYDLHRLRISVTPLQRLAGESIYLVGSVLRHHGWRDVDVRMILPDDEFDRLFADPTLWEVFCLAATAWLRAEVGLPIDFQAQRQTEANEKHKGQPRSSLSGGARFAGLGDGTPYNDLAGPAPEETTPAAPGDRGEA